MNEKKSTADIRDAVLHALHQISPETDLQELDPEVPLREELEIDSMDFLRFMMQINEELNVEVPEADYPEFETLKSGLKYLDLKINKPSSEK